MNGADDPDWLNGRERFDAAARSQVLAERLSALLPARPRLLDIAAGTGTMFRWLAPRIGRAQVWLLADENEDLVAAAFERIEYWAIRRGWTVTWPGHAMLVHTPAGAWRIEGFGVDLAKAPADLPLRGVNAVLCNALLDRVSRDWFDRLADVLRAPLLACLVGDGHCDWFPRHPADRLIQAGLARSQLCDSGLGPPLGASAPANVARTLRSRGFAVYLASSDWRVARSELTMARTLVQDAADAARAAFPRRSQAIAEWEALRLRQTLAARLAVRIGHRDILAIPRQG
jgi:SAM-dependent methyltransferase